MQFQRVIGPAGLLFAGIGSVVGSGWLFGPLYAAQVAGPASVIAWILGGIFMIIIALTFAELGSTFPIAGGMVQFAQYSHGPLVSFMTGWMVWISSITIAPVESIAILQYANNYVPGLLKMVDHIPILTHLGMLLGAVIMLVMCIFNYYGARFFSHSNTFITLIKLIVPFSTILILLVIDFHAKNFYSPQTGGFMPYGWHGVFAALPLGGIIYSFIGATTVLQLAGETKNPHFSIPLALIGSMIFCIILYSLLQVAFVGALTPDAVIQGWKNIHYEGDTGPFAGILAALSMGWFVIIIYTDALISPFGTGYIYTAATARVCYGLSRIGFLPKSIQKLSTKGVPVHGIILNFLLGLILFLPFPSWQQLMGFLISCFVISYIVGPLSLVGLRKNYPHYPRPFRLPMAGFIALVAFYICNLLIFWTGWQTIYKMMIALAIGLLFFSFHCMRHNPSLWTKQWRASWWILPYVAGISIISYLGTFGKGIGKIAFGSDFLVIGIFTGIIFYLSLKLVSQDKKDLSLDSNMQLHTNN